jgi:hypothetical protein
MLTVGPFWKIPIAPCLVRQLAAPPAGAASNSSALGGGAAAAAAAAARTSCRMCEDATAETRQQTRRCRTGCRLRRGVELGVQGESWRGGHEREGHV